MVSKIKFPQPHKKQDRIWIYKEYCEEENEAIDEFLEHPPQNFKLFGDFMTNMDTCSEKFGIIYHPQIDQQFRMERKLDDEMHQQWIKREAHEKAALEDNSKKKAPARAPVRRAKKVVEVVDNTPKLNSIQFKFTKVDIMTLKFVFYSTNDPAMFRLIKFWDCRQTEQEIEEFIRQVSRDKNIIDRIFIYYNEIENPKIYVDFLQPKLKIQMLTLSNCGINDESAIEMLDLMKDCYECIYIDLYWNNLTDAGNFFLVFKISSYREIY